MHCLIQTLVLSCEDRDFGFFVDLWINKQCVRPLPLLRLLVVYSAREHESGAKNMLVFWVLLFDICWGFFSSWKASVLAKGKYLC